MKTYDREEFLNLCETTIESFTQAMRNTAKRVGLSCDFSREYLTDAPDYRSVTQSIFVDLFKKGDIVEDFVPTSTTLSKGRPSPMPKWNDSHERRSWLMCAGPVKTERNWSFPPRDPS